MKIINIKWTLCLSLIMLACTATHAQGTEKQKDKAPFIQKGKFLTGFSVSFINASREEYGRLSPRGFTQISIQLDGLYFLSNQVGVGPLISYQFVYADFEHPFRPKDIDTRTSQFKFGVMGAYFVPLSKVFNEKSDNYFFIDAGINLLRDVFKRESQENIEEEGFFFGYQIGAGVLLPVGKQIAITTKLGFESQNQQYAVPTLDENGQRIYISKTRWTQSLSFSIGFSVTF